MRFFDTRLRTPILSLIILFSGRLLNAERVFLGDKTRLIQQCLHQRRHQIPQLLNGVISRSRKVGLWPISTNCTAFNTKEGIVTKARAKGDQLPGKRDIQTWVCTPEPRSDALSDGLVKDAVLVSVLIPWLRFGSPYECAFRVFTW